MKGDRFLLRPKAPFRLDLTVWALRRRPSNAIDVWENNTYRRVLVIEGEPVLVRVTQSGAPDTPRLTVSVNGYRGRQMPRGAVTTCLERLLGLRVDLTGFYSFAAGNRKLGPLADRFRGVKPPRFPSVFEALVNAIACQQLSLTVGIVLLSRLARAYGLSVDLADGACAHAFPQPRDLATASVRRLRAIGLSTNKASAVIELARQVASGSLRLDELAAADDASAVSRLMQVKGIGRWSAEYSLLRGLGRLHIFPGDDVGARKRLAQWLGLKGRLDYDSVGRAVARLRPYGGLVYFHMLLAGLAEAGEI